MATPSLPPSPSRRKVNQGGTPKTPGSLAHAAAFRSLQRPTAHEPSLQEAAASLGQRGARFLYLCDHGDCDYSRPLHEPHYKGGFAPRWTKRWPHWRDVLDEIAFTDVRRPSTDHWGRAVRHLPIGIEPASLNCTTLDVDIYNIPDLKLFVR